MGTDRACLPPHHLYHLPILSHPTRFSTLCILCGLWMFLTSRKSTVGPSGGTCLAESLDIPKCSGHTKAAKRWKVNKVGPNHGRYFFRCDQESKCDFFAWANPNLHQNIPSPSNPSPDLTSNPNPNSNLYVYRNRKRLKPNEATSRRRGKVKSAPRRGRVRSAGGCRGKLNARGKTRSFTRSSSSKILLCVAEKPSVARAIAEALGGGGRGVRTRAGLCKYTRVFEVEYQGRPVRVTSVLGHVMTTDFKDEGTKSWERTDPKSLFSAPIKTFVPRDMDQVAKNLRQQAKEAGELFLFLDCDREGEAIAAEVWEVCSKANPVLPAPYRAHFSSLTTDAIRRAISDPKPLNEKDVSAVSARTEIDLRLGAAFTRWQTLALRSHLHLPDPSPPPVVSYGPCQLPTLGFVVERFRQNLNFTPKAFYTLALDHLIRDRQNLTFHWNRTRVETRRELEGALERIRGERGARVKTVSEKDVRKGAPLPLSTIEFEKRAARWLRIGAKEAMGVAERLYQRGLISYPRTETNRFPDEFDHDSILAVQAQSPVWGEYAKNLLSSKRSVNHSLLNVTNTDHLTRSSRPRFRVPAKGPDDDKAHPPLHPVNFTTALTPEDAKVYQLICRHYLASCSADAQGISRTVELKKGGETFKLSITSVSDPGYLAVYPYEKWGGDASKGRLLKGYREGDLLNETEINIRVEEGLTKPPGLLPEAELIGLMHSNGIGTDATIAVHVQKIQDRGYANVINSSPSSKAARVFHPSRLGVGLVDGYARMNVVGMTTPELRREMERDLGRICDGVKSREEVVREALSQMLAVFTSVSSQASTLTTAINRWTYSKNPFDLAPLANATNAQHTPTNSSQPINTTPKEVHKRTPLDRSRGGRIASRARAVRRARGAGRGRRGRGRKKV